MTVFEITPPRFGSLVLDLPNTLKGREAEILGALRYAAIPSPLTGEIVLEAKRPTFTIIDSVKVVRPKSLKALAPPDPDEPANLLATTPPTCKAKGVPCD